MTPPPNIPQTLTFDGHGINDGANPYKPRLLTMSHTCTPELARACAALPQLLQTLEYARRCASAAMLDANPHGDLEPGDSPALDAATLERDTYRAALTAAGYTFDA